MLEGKAVVTSASTEIGRDFALALARAGARVVVNDLGVSRAGQGCGADPAEQVIAEIKASDEAAAITHSVTDRASEQRIVATAMDSFLRLDGVIYTAGFPLDRFFFNEIFPMSQS